MKGKKSTRNALFTSVLALVLCVAMLIGTTFAWFTDTASTAVNKIQAGTLDVQLLDAATNESIEGQTLRFKKATGHGTETLLWEPGCTYELPAFVVKNNGDLHLKYKIVISGIKGNAKLNHAIDWTMTETGKTDPIVINGGAEVALAPQATSGAITIKGHMREDAGNEYQGLSIDGIAITVYATQKDAEFDSFNNSYDAGATYPVEIIPAVNSNMVPAAPNSNNQIVSYSYSNSDNTLTATYVPNTPAEASAVAPKVVVEPTSKNAGNVVIDAATQDAVAYNVSLEDASGTTLNGTGSTTVKLFVGKGLYNVKVYHNDTLMTGTTYERDTGYVTFTTNSFSPFTIVFNSPVAVASGVSYYDLQSALNAARKGDTVTMLKDITENVSSTKKKAFTIERSVTLNGNGNTIKVSGDSTIDTYAMYITAPDVIIKNVTLETENLERAIRFDGVGGGKIQDAKITSNGVGIHVKGTGNVDIDNAIITVNTPSVYKYHLRTGVMVGSAASVTLTYSTVQASAHDKVPEDTSTWGKGLYVGSNAKGKLVVNNSKVTADFALAIDGSNDSKNLNNITVNSGTFAGDLGSPSGYSYKEIVINGGTFESYSVNRLNSGFYGKDDAAARLEIKGGTFSKEPEARFIPSGYGAVKNGDRYDVISGNFVSTEADLKTALGAGGTVYLASDITLESDLGTVKDGAVIDGLGHTLTWSTNDLGHIRGNDITVKNVKLNKGTNGPWGIVTGGVSYEGCTFTGLCPYIVPNQGQKISVIGCTFDKQTLQVCYHEGSGNLAQADEITTTIRENTFIVDAAAGEYYAHGLVLNTSGGNNSFWNNVQAHVTMTDNTFKCDADAMYIAYLLNNGGSNNLVADDKYVFENNTYEGTAKYALNSHKKSEGTFTDLNN